MFERIVLAVDGSEPAKRAIPVVADVASKYGSEVIVLHVLEKEVGRGGAASLETPQEAVDIADRAAKTLKDSGVSARAQARAATIGRAAHEIMQVASDEDAGLIVMGSRGISDWQGLLVGSVAHKVVHLSGVPVLIVR